MRNTIEHIVKSGAVDDNKAEAVKERLATEKAANEGDVNAIWEMGDELYNKALDMEEDCDREVPHELFPLRAVPAGSDGPPAAEAACSLQRSCVRCATTLES